MDYLHLVLVLGGDLGLLLDEPIGCLVRVAKLEYVMDFRVEYFQHAEMHPLPEHSACVIDLLIVDADLELLPQVHAGEPFQTRHEQIAAIDLEQLTP